MWKILESSFKIVGLFDMELPDSENCPGKKTLFHPKNTFFLGYYNVWKKVTCFNDAFQS